MRLVHRHAIAGATVTALATIGVLLSGVQLNSADPVPTLAVPAAPSSDGSAGTIGSLSDRQSAETSRNSDRPVLSDQRSVALGKQGKAISQAAAAAKKKADAAAAAKAKAEKARVAKLGYDPRITDPREMARQIMANKYGYGEDQFTCLDNIVMRESMWSITATNASSGAYGIPQSLPGSKMATVASDWRTNPATQIHWMIRYLDDRYGSPCGGWSFKAAHGWY